MIEAPHTNWTERRGPDKIITGASSISAGSNHSLASTSAGLAFDWGNNQYGQLGNGTTNNSSTAVQVSNLSGVQSQITASYAYNGDGLRMSKTVNLAVEPFTWGLGVGGSFLIRDSGTSFVFGPSQLPIEQIDGSGAVLYMHHDQLGSTRLLTDSVGTSIGTYTFDAYGTTVSHSGTASTSLLFNGQFFDRETNLYYLRSRYYDSATAAFITRDPIFVDTRRPYAYANGDPLNTVDPQGLWGYEYNWALGYSRSLGSAESVMRFFQKNASQAFPFPLGQCSSILYGERCDLQVQPFGDAPIQVTSCDFTSFTFTTLPGHFDPVGSTIAFSVYELNGIDYLRQTAVWNIHNPVELAEGAFTAVGAFFTWLQQAKNLSHAINPDAWDELLGAPAPPYIGP